MQSPAAIAQKYRTAHKKDPQPTWLAGACRISIDEARKVLGINDSKTILPTAAQAKAAAQDPTIEQPQPDNGVLPNPAPAIVRSKKSLRQHVQDILLAILPFVFFAAAAAGSYRSWTLCYGFFARYNTADGALTMSILLVAIAFATPQAVPILWESVKKGKRIFLFTVCVLLSAASIGTNVMITAEELANQRTDSTVASDQAGREAEQATVRIAELAERKTTLTESMELDKAERVAMAATLATLEPGTVLYNRTNNTISALRGRIDGAIESIAKIDAEVSGLRNIVTTATEKDIGQVDSIINWAGSVIIEIGGPIALSLSLFL